MISFEKFFRSKIQQESHEYLEKVSNYSLLGLNAVMKQKQLAKTKT